MKFTVETRIARKDDHDAVAQVWHDSAASADGASSGVLPLAEFRTRIHSEVAGSWTLTVALAEGRVVGMLAIKAREGVLDQLFVLPTFQGHGIGSLLLEQSMMSMPNGFP